jgi:hypothetical protein
MKGPNFTGTDAQPELSPGSPAMQSSVRKWCDENEPPAKLKGVSTAFRAGAKARAEGKALTDCRYGRKDLADAWQTGFNGLSDFIAAGGTLVCDHCGQVLNERKP